MQVSLGADGQGTKGYLGLSLAGPASKAQGEATLVFSRSGTQMLYAVILGSICLQNISAVKTKNFLLGNKTGTGEQDL